MHHWCSVSELGIARWRMRACILNQHACENVQQKFCISHWTHPGTTMWYFLLLHLGAHFACSEAASLAPGPALCDKFVAASPCCSTLAARPGRFVYAPQNAGSLASQLARQQAGSRPAAARKRPSDVLPHERTTGQHMRARLMLRGRMRHRRVTICQSRPTTSCGQALIQCGEADWPW